MKIICIGRNYAKHAKELGNAIPEEPLFFLKPDSAVLPYRHPFFIPDWTKDVHYEVELVVRINRLGKYIQTEFAHRYYDEIGLGIDFTARDIQKQCKEKGQPWEKAKAFDGSAVISKDFLKLKDVGEIGNIPFSLKKNQELVQEGNSRDMLFHVDQLIAHVSQFMTLKIGDLLFTGTPEGVGPVQAEDELEGFLGEVPMFKIQVR